MDSLQQQFEFLHEIDRLKTVIRQTLILDRSRRENSAEHSWHLAMYAMVLHRHANEPVDVSRVIQMLLIHDIVEVDAGDLPLHGNADYQEQAIREQRAAERLFGLLPADQGQELLQLWQEFEQAESADARFAKALDRLQPVMHNLETEGGTWPEFNVDEEKVMRRCRPPIESGARALWQRISDRIRTHFRNSA